MTPAALHTLREADARAQEDRARETSRRLSAARLLTMLSSVAAGAWALDSAAPPGVGWAAAIGMAGFLALVVVHDRVERRVLWLATVADWHRDRGLRLARAWSALPAPFEPERDSHHPYAGDLDLFGKASLCELIGPPGTQAGRSVLAAWLLELADAGEVRRRQAAVSELAARPDLCEPIAAHGRIVGRVAAFDLGVFLGWAEGAPWLRAHAWMYVAACGVAVATVVLLALQLAGLVEGTWWLGTLILGLVLSWMTRRPMEAAIGMASGWERAIRAYVEWLSLVEHGSFAAPALQDLRQQIASGASPASRQIRRFQRLVSLADLRHNALLHLPVHALTLWDFHVWWALERWQHANGARVRTWIEALGRFEAFANLATLAHDHPDWVQPGVDETAHAYEARAIGHPLIRPDVCVRNDVRVGPPGRVLCITGSNMSGKSTLLRAIGANAVLAHAGAPVCAEALSLPPVSLYTSLRVLDSLAEGVSFFMAAVEQLQRLVRAADAAAATPSTPGAHASGTASRRIVLYLLDEILQGTNSVERASAVRLVLRHLLRTPAIGAITTHDLALTSTPELQSAGDHAHFRETIHEDDSGFRMTFDYRLRPGVATSRNALALLRLVGLTDGTETAD